MKATSCPSSSNASTRSAARVERGGARRAFRCHGKHQSFDHDVRSGFTDDRLRPSHRSDVSARRDDGRGPVQCSKRTDGQQVGGAGADAHADETTRHRWVGWCRSRGPPLGHDLLDGGAHELGLGSATPAGKGAELGFELVREVHGRLAHARRVIRRAWVTTRAAGCSSSASGRATPSTSPSGPCGP